VTGDYPSIASSDSDKQCLVRKEKKKQLKKFKDNHFSLMYIIARQVKLCTKTCNSLSMIRGIGTNIVLFVVPIITRMRCKGNPHISSTPHPPKPTGMGGNSSGGNNRGGGHGVDLLCCPRPQTLPALWDRSAVH
jgi:hypothetical protein